MTMWSFSSLKGALPGRANRSSKRPEQDTAAPTVSAEEPTDEARDHPPSRVGIGRASGTAPANAYVADLNKEQNVSLGAQSYEESRLRKFEGILSKGFVDLQALEAAAWTGIPHILRPRCWRLLLRYEPPSQTRAKPTVKRKRQEYQDMVPAYYDIDNELRSDDDIADLKQVSVDVPRTAPDVPFFQQDPMQATLRRLLYIWGVRHPASGYVQGVNDLVTPFLAVFLSAHFDTDDMSVWQAGDLTEAQLVDAEADSYWCLCKLVERVQDVYTAGQPGIQQCLHQLSELTSRVDSALLSHFDEEGISFFQFAFRWVNCMLIRELPFQVSIRLWDTYLAEGTRFSEFLPYACAAFLLYWSKKLKTMDFQGMILFLQKTPTRAWGYKELEMVLSHAHMLRASFDDSHGHLSK